MVFFYTFLQAQLLAQKRLQKLLNKKKFKSPIKADSADNKNFQAAAVNETVKSPGVSSENSRTNICSTEIHSQDNIISNRIVNPSLSEAQKHFKISSPDKFYSSDQNVQNCKKNLFNETLNQTELKDTASETEEKSE